MAFTSFLYLTFLFIVLVATRFVAHAPNVRNVLLLIASWVFYAWWNPILLLLLVFLSALFHLAGLTIANAGPQQGRRILVLAVGVSLAGLAVFKYAGFLLDTAEALTALVGVGLPRPVLEIAMPVGISFYAFAGIAYVVDVWRGKVPAEPTFVNTALLMGFFPAVVAGPIPRAGELLPQLRTVQPNDATREGRAIARIVRGLVKKLLLADLLGAHLVDRVFDLPNRFSSLEALAAAYGYTFQIYFDFSGYTDIAIGSAALLGLTLTENFDAPYRATNLREFWRRWHITLSKWLRDYLYIPLGGSREGGLVSSLILTMALGGLWHGAAWTFVAWGLVHGVGLVMTHVWHDARVHRPYFREGSLPFRRVVAWFATFNVITAAWVLFRAESFENALAVYRQIVAGVPGFENLSWTAVLLLAASAIVIAFPQRLLTALVEGFARLPAPAQAALLVVAAWLVVRLSSGSVSPFVYVQF